MEVREETITNKPSLQGKKQNTLDTIKKKKKKKHLWIQMKTPLSALQPAHSYKSSVENEFYLAEIKRAISNTKIILKNAYFQDLNSSSIHIQTAGDEALSSHHYKLK